MPRAWRAARPCNSAHQRSSNVQGCTESMNPVTSTTSWDDLRIFLAMFRGGSQKAAAKRLNVAHTTIGRRLSALEASLGARLFDRTPNGIALTAVGLALLPRAERVEAEV